MDIWFVSLPSNSSITLGNVCFSLRILSGMTSEVMAFNLSMGLGITDSTIGVRYSNYTNGFLNMKHEHGYILDTTKALISHLLDIVPSDHFVKKCSTYRDEICDDFGFTPTNVVSLCLASYEDEFFLDRDSSPYPTVNISMALTKKLEGTYNVK